ncbi:hypothetical protein [Winogradskyella sp.]|uniref:hypothetical protein n=1 Tax=Winogradskyella sp. TaxID=1883156 RepID=UPI0026399941|nr:hypothetical protein [Winogradskyella sp.]
MKKSIFVHIGTHKTGTSIIQKILIENPNALKKEGVKYINLHNFKRAAVIVKLEAENVSLVEELKSFINSYIDESYNKYIICCEYLSGNPKLLYQNVLTVAKLLHQSLTEFEEKKIFVALRKQEQFIQSIYTQYVHQAEDVPIETFLDKTKLEHIKWSGFVEKYRSVFGTQNVTCVPYDKKVLEKKNILNRFGEFSNVSFLKQVSLETLNHGYSKEAMAIAKECNPELSKEEQKILRQILQTHLSKDVFSKYELLSKEDVDDLDAFFKADNEILFQTYLSGFGITAFSHSVGQSESSSKEKNAYAKLIIVLLKRVNTLSKLKISSVDAMSKSELKVILVGIKRGLKRRLKRLIKKDIHVYNENIELKKKFGNYKQAVVLGSSSSINKLDVTEYADDFVISVGNFYEHPKINEINPKIHVFAASHPPITNEVLEAWWKRCNEILPKHTPILVEKRDRGVAETIFADREVYYYSYGGHLPVDFTRPVMSPWSVTIIALQLAIYCKSEKIGILGVNHDWQGLTTYAHFYDHNKPSLEYYLKQAGIDVSHQQTDKRLPKSRLYKEYRLYQQYEALKAETERLGINIYNYDPFSDFDVFELDKKTELIIDEENNG